MTKDNLSLSGAPKPGATIPAAAQAASEAARKAAANARAGAAPTAPPAAAAPAKPEPSPADAAKADAAKKDVAKAETPKVAAPKPAASPSGTASTSGPQGAPGGRGGAGGAAPITATLDLSAPAPLDTRPPILAGFVVIALVFGVIGAWAMFAPLASAVLAPGTVVVESNRKAVQHLEGGIVKEILVKEGDFVRQGDVLVQLDPLQAEATAVGLQQQYDSFRAVEARLTAERDGRDEISFPEDLIARANLPVVRQLLDSQRKEFIERRRTIEGQEAILRERIARSEREVGGLMAQKTAKEEQVRLINEELTGLKELYQKGYIPRTRILALEREAARLVGEIGEAEAGIARAGEGIDETKLQISQLTQQFTENVISELRSVQVNVNDLRERLVVARDRLKRIDILAPQDGVVQNLQIFTLGGVVAPGMQLMEIVPFGDRLVVSAQVAPQDVDNIAVGMTAEVRLIAVQTRTTPSIFGVVENVSADRLVDQNTGIPYYEARIVLMDKELEKLDEGKKLQAGMPAEVLVTTGERTVAEYLMCKTSDLI